MLLQRHDMVFLKARAVARITRELLAYHHIDEKKVLLSPWYLLFVKGLIPAIIRRNDNEVESPAGNVPIGICLPIRIDGQRVRFASWVSQQDILQVMTPFQIPALPIRAISHSLVVLQTIINQWPIAKSRLGVWGSNALEILTGLAYTDDKSDLDIIMCSDNRSELKAVYDLVILLEKQFLCRIDVEIRLYNHYGISLKEFFQQGCYVLGKSLADVTLLNKADIRLS